MEFNEKCRHPEGEGVQMQLVAFYHLHRETEEESQLLLRPVRPFLSPSGRSGGFFNIL